MFDCREEDQREEGGERRPYRENTKTSDKTKRNHRTAENSILGV